jgi:hypothetical protein
LLFRFVSLTRSIVLSYFFLFFGCLCRKERRQATTLVAICLTFLSFVALGGSILRVRTPCYSGSCSDLEEPIFYLSVAMIMAVCTGFYLVYQVWKTPVPDQLPVASAEGSDEAKPAPAPDNAAKTSKFLQISIGLLVVGSGFFVFGAVGIRNCLFFVKAFGSTYGSLDLSPFRATGLCATSRVLLYFGYAFFLASTVAFGYTAWLDKTRRFGMAIYGK